MNYDYDLVVLGGGHNGLTAATLLAQKGQRVALFEARKVLGGLCAAEEFVPGYRSPGILHDTSALRRWAVDRLGIADRLQWRSGPAPVFCPEPANEGPGLLLGPDTLEEIRVHSSKDASSWPEFQERLSNLAPWIRARTDRAPPDLLAPQLRDLQGIGAAAVGLRSKGRRTLLEVLRILPMCTADWLGEWFESDVLRAMLAAPALYATGLGPHAPATNANLIHEACIEHGGLYGGAEGLVEALVGAATAAGVEILTTSPVDRIDIEDGHVHGVTLHDGSSVSAPAVAASCDPKTLLLDLVPGEHLSLKLRSRIRNYRARGSSAKVHLALDGLPELACRPGFAYPSRLRIGAHLADLERAADALKYRRFSPEPALDVYVPTQESAPTRELAPTLESRFAPAGHHVFSILAHCAPYELEGGWSAARTAEFYESVLATLETHLPAVREHIVGQQILTPADLARRYRLAGGHLLHGEPALDQMLVRPVPDCTGYTSPIDGLFLCGGGSHPGGGITCAPGALAAQRILESKSRD